MTVRPASQPDERRLSDQGLAIIAALVEARTGQEIAPNRVWRVETALKPLLRGSGASSLDEFVSHVVAAADGVLIDAVVDAILNNETSFFRDAGVFDQVAEAARIRAQEAGGRMRIWSVGCSTGQEPYSLAILLAEKMGIDDPAFPEILATDVSAQALNRARAATFSQFEIQRGMPVRRMVEWFEKRGEQWTAHPDLIRKVQFRRHNLASDPCPAGKFDLILCRNLLFYFAPERRHRLFDRLAGVLANEGLLVLGAGETVIGQARGLVPSERFRGFYCRAAEDAGRT